MNAIEIHNVSKQFGTVSAVDTVSFEVKEGQVFGFLGPNGAGKTTTIRMMMDFIRPDSGSISILGKDAQKHETELKKEMGYLSGEVHLYENWTGERHIAFINKLNGTQDISTELIERLGLDPTKKTKQLSSGNKQKLGLILAFMSKPKLLILDEPTNGLDPLLQKEVYELIREAVAGGATVFMSSHNLPEVERVCDHVGIIRKGKIIATESIRSLKGKKIFTVRVQFAKKVDSKHFLESDTELVQEIQDGFIIKVKKDINSLLAKIQEYSVTDLEVSQASLEDVFIEYYK